MSEPYTALELRGHGGHALPCVFRGSGGEAAIAIVLPGRSLHGGRIGGTPARPDLSYTSSLLRSLGLGVLEVWWKTDELPEGPALDEWLRENARGAFEAASERGPVRVVVARSLGTMALARSPEADGGAVTVWLAPLVREPGVAQAIVRAGSRAFVLAGSADALWDAHTGEALRRAGAHVKVLPGGDHSFDVGDPAESARLLADALDELRAFLSAASAGGEPA